MVKPGADNQVVHTKANTNQHLFREDLPIQARLWVHCLHGMETRMFNFWRRVNTIAQFRFFYQCSRVSGFCIFTGLHWAKYQHWRHQTTLYCVVSSFENLLWIVSLQNFWRILPEAAALCLAHADKDLPRNLTKTVFITRHSSSDIQQKKPARKNRPNWNSIQHNAGFEEEIVVFSVEIKM